MNRESDAGLAHELDGQHLSADAVRKVVRQALPALAANEIAEIEEGGDFSTWRIDQTAVVKFAPDEQAQRALRREITALSVVRDAIRIAVPACLYEASSNPDGARFAVFSWVTGEPAEYRVLRATSHAMRELIDFVEDVHSVDPNLLEAVPREAEDRGTPREALERAARWSRAADELPNDLRDQVREFLEDKPAVPRLPARQPVFSHTDLKGEHIFVDAHDRVSGIIDWADVAVTHPIDDYVGLVISVGLRALHAAMRGRADEPLVQAVAHYARCATVENLGLRVAGESVAPLALLTRQLQRAFEPVA